MIIFLLLVTSCEIAYAFSTSLFVYGGLFAGKVSEVKATEIEEKENDGFTCLDVGMTITIDRPIKGPETYIIPTGTMSKTGKDVSVNSWIMGKYEGTTSVTCEKQEGETTIIEEVDLNTITLFGNS